MRRSVLLVAFAALLLVAGCGGAGNTANTSTVGPKQDKFAGFERCPRRALAALPLNAAAEKSARRIAKRRVGRSPQITIRVRPAADAGARGREVRFLCGPKVARRAVVVFTYDHRYDRGRTRGRAWLSIPSWSRASPTAIGCGTWSTKRAGSYSVQPGSDTPARSAALAWPPSDPRSRPGLRDRTGAPHMRMTHIQMSRADRPARECQGAGNRRCVARPATAKQCDEHGT